MKINNSEREILETIRKRYSKTIGFKSNNSIKKIESAIMTIEMYNRNCIWRIIEYFVLFLYSVKYLFTKKIDNISIGRYQLKISFILDYLNIQYFIRGRDITLKNLKTFPLFNIFFNRNTPEVLDLLITSARFRVTEYTDINSTAVQYFVEEYSRTLPTDIGFSYYFVFKSIVN